MTVDRADGYPGNESQGGFLPPISLSNSVVSRASDTTPMGNKRKIRGKSDSSSGTDSDYTSLYSESPTKLPSLHSKSNSIVSLMSNIPIPRLCRTPSCPQLHGAFDEEDYMASPPQRARKPKAKANDDSVKLPRIHDKSPGYMTSQPAGTQHTRQSNGMTPSTIVGESSDWYNQKHLERNYYENPRDDSFLSSNAYTPAPIPTPALLLPLKEMEARNRKKTKREKKKRRQTTEVQFHEAAEVKPKQVGNSAFEDSVGDKKKESMDNKENAANVRTGQVHGSIYVYADKKHETAVVENELVLSQSERKCREWLVGVDNQPTSSTAEREKVATTS